MLEDKGKYFTCIQFRLSRDYYESIGMKFDTEEEFLGLLVRKFCDPYTIDFHSAVYSDNNHYQNLAYEYLKHEPLDMHNYSKERNDEVKQLRAHEDKIRERRIKERERAQQYGY